MPALMDTGLTPIKRSYSSLTSLGDEATFSKNVRTGMLGKAILSSSLMRTSSFGCWDLGSARPLRPLFREVLPWHGLPPPTRMAWMLRFLMRPRNISALTHSTVGTWTIWSMVASAILTTSGLLSAART